MNLLMIDVNVNPVAFSIFGIDVRWYVIIITLGMILSVYIANKNYLKREFPDEFAFDLFLIILPFAIIGARIWYVIFEWKQYVNNPIEIFNIRAGGLAIHGGIILSLLAGLVYCNHKKIPFIDVTDIALASLPLGQSIGRWGNFMNMEAYGYETNLPWAMNINGVGVHPTFLYESLADLLIFIFLQHMLKNQKFSGTISSFYLILYGIVRFFIEGLRTDSLYIFGLRTAQLVSILFVIFGIMLLAYSFNRKKNIFIWKKRK
ncbi:MAG: prolipoprotein diacylglyceryl transferase [Peptoniphilaceae bacterium]|nr:prolipoprotein diacylglyceryl transferase [Peptoniphilaceae bacterium]